jgi:surface polysaccharide O-acyltransferase-like enzyme
MFALGVVASRSNWLNSIDYKKGRRWMIIANVLVLSFPLLYVVKIITNSPLDTFNGNGTWQSLLNALWEQITGISIMVALLGICRQKWNTSKPLLQKMARSAYATYIIHPLFIISIALLLKNWDIEPAIKLLVAAPIAVTTSFIFAGLLVNLPGVKEVV